jgi:hypothetical protein
MQGVASGEGRCVTQGGMRPCRVGYAALAVWRIARRNPSFSAS